MVGVDFGVLVRHRWQQQFSRNSSLRRIGEPNGKEHMHNAMGAVGTVEGVERISRVSISFGDKGHSNGKGNGK